MVRDANIVFADVSETTRIEIKEARKSEWASKHWPTPLLHVVARVEEDEALALPSAITESLG